MRIVLATSGSRGDAQPMIALSLGFKDTGHDVLLIGPPEKKQWALQLGCPYKGLGRDVTAFLDTIKNPISIPTAISFVKYVRQEIHNQFKVLPKLVEGADIVIGSSLMFGLSSLAEFLNIRYRYVAFTPSIVSIVLPPLNQFFNYQKLNVKKNTFRNYEFILDRFQAHFGDINLSSISADDILFSF